ncbi:hypothetical protein DFH09DRAFT_1329180 [Mycena vulgaris]|nr:hypothetical protein DFH09DRAFT_1329180 [Mycena vulgaris]
MGEDLSDWDHENYNIFVVKSHRQTYVSKFTHGDLASRNVLVHNSRISATMDRDYAGWRPEYWEVTKSKFASLGTPTEWFDALDRACESSYELQLEVELRLWKAAEFPSSPGTVLDPPEGVDARLESASIGTVESMYTCIPVVLAG